jgi:UDP-N-acetylmuramyl pentapeptide synthase
VDWRSAGVAGGDLVVAVRGELVGGAAVHTPGSPPPGAGIQAAHGRVPGAARGLGASEERSPRSGRAPHGPPGHIERRFRLPLVGRHTGVDAVCALAAVIAATGQGEAASEAVLDAAIAGLATARPARRRSELAVVAGRNVLVDCYNANPTSMAAAIDTMAELRGDRRAVAVLGDMLELGDEAAAAHREVGRHAAARGIGVIAIGELAAEIAAGATEAGGEVWRASDVAAAAHAARAATADGDWVLVKASRGMRLERVVEALEHGDGG